MVPRPAEACADLIDRDHERLLLMLDDVVHLSRSGSHRTASKVFGEFRILQEQHLTRTLEVVELLERRGGCGAALKARLTREQQRLREAMAAAWDQLSSGDREGIEQSVAALAHSVSAHERAQKEDLLPPLCAAFVDPGELSRVVHHLLDL